MLTNLVTVTPEHIDESASRAVEEKNSVVMHLQNSGDKAHRWKNADINVWLCDDIDE